MRLRIRVKNSQYEKRHLYSKYMRIPAFRDYEGEIYPSPKWVGDDSFCLKTDDHKYSFRVIPKEMIMCGWKLS
jgi:hypothetical protein